VRTSVFQTNENADVAEYFDYNNKSINESVLLYLSKTFYVTDSNPVWVYLILYAHSISIFSSSVGFVLENGIAFMIITNIREGIVRTHTFRCLFGTTITVERRSLENKRRRIFVEIIILKRDDSRF